MKLKAIAAAGGLAVALAAGHAQADPVKIRVAWVVPVGNLPTLVWEAPIPNHAGKTYDPQLTYFQGTPQMITALGANQLDVADLAFSSLALAIENAGMTDLRVIADEGQDGVGNYASAPYYVRNDGSVTKVEDLKGKTVADVGPGSAVDIGLRAMLLKHGLQDKRDYNVVAAGFASMKSLLLEKKADLISEVAPFDLQPDLNQNAHVLFTNKDVMGPTQYVMWTAKKEFIDANRAALTDFLEDSIRAWQWYLDTKNRTQALEIASRVSKQPVDNMKDYLWTEKDVYRSPTLMPNIGGLQAAWDAQNELGLLSSPLKAADYADLSPVEAAAARLK